MAIDEFKIRKATKEDLPLLDSLEKKCFSSDLLSRRSFKNFVDSKTARLFVAANDTEIAAYILLLFKKGSSLSRLYSLAVHPDYRKLGLAGKLLDYIEEVAQKKKAVYIRLEVSVENKGAIKLYESKGYTVNSRKEDYYEDGTAALIYQKRVLFPDRFAVTDINFYPQTIDFTCGPACLMMAISCLNKKFIPNLDDELNIWREANTVFMSSGHAGCSAAGLALAALNRGFQVKLIANKKGTPFTEGLRDEAKREIVSRVHNSFIKSLKDRKVDISYGRISFTNLIMSIKEGWVPIILISMYRLQQSKSPHWVVVTGCDNNFIYIHDPYVVKDNSSADLENMNIPVSRSDFMKMSKFGSRQLRSCLMLKK
ncbi:MAG: GNAT family N-acetyltransferase/peptidase C39 family protein [Lentisphaeraceae bacterium]|nr:GNAT family N-acetyltransferase/peptidase C39 family protein [Lentisphaeraceae bacterium]